MAVRQTCGGFDNPSGGGVNEWAANQQMVNEWGGAQDLSTFHEYAGSHLMANTEINQARLGRQMKPARSRQPARSRTHAA